MILRGKLNNGMHKVSLVRGTGAFVICMREVVFTDFATEGGLELKISIVRPGSARSTLSLERFSKPKPQMLYIYASNRAQKISAGGED